MILAGPGFNAGRSAAAVTLEDVLPTLLKRLDIPEPGRLDGHDLFSETRPDWVRGVWQRPTCPTGGLPGCRTREASSLHKRTAILPLRSPEEASATL